jgi:pimeloyl-ACP methyl ester carboxylesterase
LPGVVPDLNRGELLLFLHDAGGNAAVWQPHVDAFGKDHSPIALDFPGHGRSGGTESLGSIDAYCSFLAALIDALALRPAVLVGHGMGAAVAVAMAARAPERVRALVLVGAAARGEVPAATLETWANVMRGRSPQPFTTEAFSPKTDFAVMRQAWTEQVKTDPRVRYFDLLAWSNYDARPHLGAIRVPTLIAVGKDDGVTPPSQADELKHAIAGSRLAVVDDAGHWLPLEKPAELQAAIAPLLGGSGDRSDGSDRSGGSVG